VIADPGLTTRTAGWPTGSTTSSRRCAKPLDPDKLHPRILLVSAVGLGKVMITLLAFPTRWFCCGSGGEGHSVGHEGGTSGNPRPNSWS
jgi:hypothetical protein